MVIFQTRKPGGNMSNCQSKGAKPEAAPVNPYEYSDAAKEQLKDLRAKLSDGDMSQAEYDEQADTIKADDYRQRLQAQEAANWNKAVNRFLDENQAYRQDSLKYAALDAEVRRLGNNPGEIEGLTCLEILAKAKANVETTKDDSKKSRASKMKRFPQYRASKKIIIAGLALFLLAGLFPPWNSVVNSKGYYIEGSLGYHLFFDPPIAERYASAKIDFSRLGLQWFLIVCTAGAVLYLRRPEQKERGT
jgi:hypothetical protein